MRIQLDLTIEPKVLLSLTAMIQAAIALLR